MTTIAPTDRLSHGAMLFTASGKVAVAILDLNANTAVIEPQAVVANGAIALLTRHGVRVFGTIEPIDANLLAMRFDEPLEGWRRERFVDRANSKTSVTIHELQAA